MPKELGAVIFERDNEEDGARTARDLLSRRIFKFNKDCVPGVYQLEYKRGFDVFSKIFDHKMNGVERRIGDEALREALKKIREGRKNK